MKPLLIACLFTLAVFGQDKDADRLITVPQRYVSAEGLSHKVEGGGLITQFAGIGKEIGIATRDGLNAVVDVSQGFGTTSVGHFVMFMIFWKIMGHQVVAVVLGIPIWIGGVWVWWLSLKRFFWGRRMLSEYDAATKRKTWTIAPAYKFDSSDARATAGAVHMIFVAGWTIAFMLIVFGVW